MEDDPKGTKPYGDNKSDEEQDNADHHKVKKLRKENSEDPTGSDLALKLEDAGLDQVFWTDIFKNVLNVTSSKQLQYLGGMEYKELEKHVRHEWEKRALQKLLGVPDRKRKLVEEEQCIRKAEEQQQEASKKRQDKELKSLKEKEEQLRNDLAELRKLQKEGKERRDAEVKEMEDKIRSALEVPKESWVPTSRPLQDLIDNINRQLNVLESFSVSLPEVISDEDVLKNASGGLALEGVFKTGRLNDMVGTREQLIEVPESFSLRGPQQSCFYEQKEFSSHESQTVFQKVLEKLGFSFSSSLKAGFWGLTLENTTEQTKSAETQKSGKTSSEQSCIFNTKYNYIPLASCFIHKDKLKLSPAALVDLKHVEIILLNNNERISLGNRIAKFFERFGSHANQGPLHFGGVFLWKASAEGFRSTKLTEMKSLMSEALNVYIGAGYSGPTVSCSGGVNVSTAQMKGSFTGKYSETLMSKVQLSVSRTGGPADTDNHLQWKSTLVTSNKTWHVIDRGTTLIPVWDIILHAHRGDFKDVLKLSSSLMEAYRMITNQNVEELWGENVLTAVREAEMMIQSVKEWTVSESEEHLNELLQFKIKMKDKTGSNNTWIQMCLSNQVIQDFLLKIVKEHEYEETIYLRMLMRSLLDPHLYSVKKFPSRAEILKWAYQNESEMQLHKAISVSEISELNKILKNSKEQLQDSVYALNTSETVHHAKIKATCSVTLSLNSLRWTLRDNNEEEADLLLCSILGVVGYSKQDNTFDHLLGWDEIEFLENELQKHYDKYYCLRKKDASQAQAYLVLTAVTVCKDGKSVSSRDKGRRLQYLKAEMKETLSAVSTAIEIEAQYQDWERFEQELNSIIMTSQLSEQNVKQDQMFNDLERMLHCEDIAFSEDGQKDQQPSQYTQDDSLSNMTRTDPDGKCEVTLPVKSEKCDAFMNLLQKLGLRNSYPKKLRKTDVLVIDILSQNAKSPTKEEQLRFHYLYKLMMLDYSARNLFIKAQITKSDGQCMEDQILPDDEDSADDDFFNTDEDCNENVRFQESHIHPMDIHMAVFHCANDFLKQYLFSKLSTCQFGLPLLVPNPCTGEVEFPLWALRQIKKSWQHNQQSETGSTVKYNSKEMFNTPVPIVSFIRLGSSVTSKSQILNNVISKKKHSVFFHRHCRGSTEHCLLMDGVVEIAWYCPGGKDDVFDDCVAFMNLHGDASKHPKQLTFLQQVSTVNVALLSENPLDEEARKTSETLSKSPVPFICLFAGKEKVARGKNPTKVRLGAKNRNEAELTDEIISAIKHCVSTNEKTSSLKTYLEAARDQQFRVDEDNEACRQGKGMAQTLLCLLKEEKVSRLKEKFLPLQGELWHSWCRKDKEQYRLESKAKRSIEQQLSDIRAQKLSIRHQQIQKASPINDLIRSFLECLASPEHSQDAKLYMLQWLRIYLDELLTDTLTDLQEKYHSVWTELRKKQKNKDDFNHLQEDLNKISEDLNSTTFGFQHFMREIGQVYEAVQTVPEKLKDRRHHIDNLPAIGAEMLISGYPLELMDGDTAHVPLVWIEAVLEKLKKKTGNKRVFVLSVLGVQSSGKSTLLNTMFGLQFTVSAGRCTRGAFMQLVRVDEEVREQLQYDYVLVVDTEGLRSPELSTKTTLCHDNELATLIIGIGDMTLINIMGENPSEMQDILQICVQAFLRMKSVKIKPSCIFVHQNVAESSANDKNMEGRRRLQERLDEMTQIAAKEEHCDSTGFSDVIQFDVESQVFYFKNLLEGDPPMAPPNPSYSQNVQDLKTKLLSIAQWQRDFKAPTLSELKLRIHDLWNALLGENFVFSFRNTLEIMVYSKLEESYGQWRWKLRKHALEVQKTLHNQIMSKKIQDVNQSELNKDFDKVYNPLKTEIEKYFKEQKYPELLIKWKVSIEKRFEVLNKDLIAETVDQCKVLISLKQSQADLDNRKLEYEAQLLSMSKALASTLKEQMLTDEKVRQEFDKLWVEWVAKVSSEKPPEKDADIKSAVDNILLQTFSTIADNSNQIANKKTHFKFNKTKHIDQSWKQWARSTWNKFTHKEPPLETIGTELTKRIFTKVSEYIDEKQEEKMGFNENFIHQILDQIKSEISESEKSLQYIQFTVQYRFEISVHLCTSAITRFEKMHAAFMRANDPLTYLKSKRDQYLDIFKNFCEGASSITFFVDFLCKQLEPLIQQEAYDKVFIGIIGEMKSNNKMFNGNRSNLENHILKQLAEKKDFDLYMEYINHPKEYFAKFISEQVEEFCRDRKKISGMLNEKQTDLIECILNLSKTVTTAVMEKKGKASMWLDEFCREINIGLSRDDLKNIEREDIADLGFLKDMMAKSLREMLENVKKENSRKPQFDLKMFSKDPAVQLGLIFEGCWEQCPFCKAVCTNTVADHPDDHSVQFHRPEALAGWHYLFSGEFSIDFCTSSVISDGSFIPAEKSLFQSVPFKKYKDAGPPYNKWKITGDNSAKNYWKWFIHTFRSQLEGRFKLKFVGKGTIPNDWKTITEADVMEELG